MPTTVITQVYCAISCQRSSYAILVRCVITSLEIRRPRSTHARFRNWLRFWPAARVRWNRTASQREVRRARCSCGVARVYPNGRLLTYNYTAAIDAAVSRLTSISDNSITLESLSYLGLGTVVKRAHPQPGVDLTYIGTPGDAGDEYAGLDRFGRIIEQFWTN